MASDLGWMISGQTGSVQYNCAERLSLEHKWNLLEPIMANAIFNT